MAVIDRLEVVDIQNHQRHVPLEILRLAQHHPQMAVEIAAIVEPRHVIGHG